jgi:hypothetical protein
MHDAAWLALSQYCSLFSGVANGLNHKYYPRHLTGSTKSVIVSPIGKGNPRLSSTINLITVLNIELYHVLDVLSKAHEEKS